MRPRQRRVSSAEPSRVDDAARGNLADRAGRVVRLGCGSLVLGHLGLAVAGRLLPRGPHRRQRRHRPVRAGQPHVTRRALGDRDEDLGELGLVQRLPLQELADQGVEHLAVIVEDVPRLVVREVDQAPDLLVDHCGHLLGVVTRVADVPAEEHLAAGLAHPDRADPLAHAELGDHLAGDGGGLLDVVGRAGRRVVEHDLLGDPPAHRVRQLVHQLVAGGGVPVLGRHHHRVAQGPASRQDRHLGHRVGVPERRRDEGMAALVVRSDLLLLVVHQPGPLLRSGDDPVDRLVQLVVADHLPAAACGEQRRLVQHVRQVGAGEPRGPLGDRVQVDVGRHRLALGVHLQDVLPAAQVGRVHRDLPVEPPRPQQGRIEDVRPVRRRDQDHVGVGVEAVHLDEHLVKRLLALVVAAAEAGAAVPADGVDLVDEDDRRGVLLGLVEQVAHPGRADADEHLDEVRTGDRVERHAGLARDGASRVRDLFDQAKQNAPAIIFIDEIDAVGRHRGAGMGGGHDEREQTLNQMLVEMDGFDANANVILIAATNRPDILDPALLRPGRFDRQLAVDPPDLKGRAQILTVHAQGKPMAPGVDLEVVARRTPGFTGADLANVLNEAALLTARTGGQEIGNHELDEAIDRVVAGPQKRTRIMKLDQQKITAYHEGGHAVVAAALRYTDPVTKVTILPRGRALGYTMVMPLEDKYSTTRNELLDQLAYSIGGRVAEELVFHDPTTGASNDIEKATEVARKMVTQYGMSENIGAIKLGQASGEVFMGRDMGHGREYSETVAATVDVEIRRLIEAAHDEAWSILITYRDVLDHLVLELLEHETLNQAELATIFAPMVKNAPRDVW